MKLVQWEVDYWKSVVSSVEELGFSFIWVQRVLHTDKLVHSDLGGMSPVCNFAHKCFGVWKTSICKSKIGFEFCAKRNLAESSKNEKFSLGSFLKFKRFDSRLDEQFLPEAVQSNQL